MTPSQIESLRRDIVAASHALHQRGWVANHDGNLSARLDAEHDPEMRLLCTPTAVSKGDVQPEWLIVVDQDRKVLQGTRRGFSELALHVAAFRARPDIGVVIHAHPPTATGFAVAGVALPHPFMAEAVVSLGRSLPMVPYARPGDARLEADLASALSDADVAILAGHGVLTVGGSFEQAMLRMELVEHIARIALAAQQLGGVQPLPAEDVEALCAKGRPASCPARVASSPMSSDPLSPEPRSPAAAAVPLGTRLGSPGTPAVTGSRPDLHGVVADALSRFR